MGIAQADAAVSSFPDFLVRCIVTKRVPDELVDLVRGQPNAALLEQAHDVEIVLLLSDGLHRRSDPHRTLREQPREEWRHGHACFRESLSYRLVACASFCKLRRRQLQIPENAIEKGQRVKRNVLGDTEAAGGQWAHDVFPNTLVAKLWQSEKRVFREKISETILINN